MLCLVDFVKYVLLIVLGHCLNTLWVSKLGRNMYLYPQDTRRKFVCIKAKRGISKQYMYVSGGKKSSFFRKIWRALLFCYLRFKNCPLALLPTNWAWTRRPESLGRLLDITYMFKVRSWSRGYGLAGQKLFSKINNCFDSFTFNTLDINICFCKKF